jgi:hypothetical protein
MTSGSDWVEQARRLMDGLRAAAPAEGATAGGATAAGGDCRWCPLCQAAALVRGERPELSAALADILTATAAALRQFAGEPAAPPDAGPAPTPADDGPPVQRIELR